jgi:O-antigen/teichoic acid export membrane protein
MRLGRTALSHFVSQIVVTLSGFLATWLIAFFLGSEGLGRYSVIVSLGFFWLIIPSSAICSAITKRMSENETPAAFFGGGLILNLINALIVISLVLVAGDLLSGIVSRDREIISILIEYDLEISVLILSTISYSTVMAALNGQKRVATTGWLAAGERFTRAGLQAGAVLLGLGVAGLTFGHAGALVLSTLAAVLISRLRPSIPSITHIRSLLNYAKYAWMGALRGRTFGWLDTIVLSFFVNASLIGIYEAAWGIGSMLAIGSDSISRTLFPEISDLSTDTGYDRIRHHLNEALAFSGILVIPGLFGAAVLGERILRFYRPEFGRGTSVLLILIVAYLFDVFASQFMNVLNGIDRPDAAFRVNIVFVALNIFLNIILVWLMGWYGAAIATAVSTSFRTIAGYWMVESTLGDVSVPFTEIARQAAAALVMVILLYPVAPFAPVGRLGTVLLVGFGATVYSVVLIAIAPRIRSKAFSMVPVR